MATAMDVLASPGLPTVIGKVGENEFRRIKFPIATWLELYPGATFTLAHQRSADQFGYPVTNVTTDSSYLYWTVTSGDLAYPGAGQAELSIKSGDSIAKSVTYPTQVMDSVVDSENPPDPWESYIDRITSMIFVPVSGSTPSITAQSGCCYECGEVSTLAITLPSSGCIDVTFVSGSSATTLTITLPTGVTEILWLDEFDPDNLDANTVYELNIKTSGTNCLGVAAAWTL